MEFINKNPKVYILAGKARAGKDTTAIYIKDYYEKNGKKVAILQYSSYLKEYAKKITNWDGSDETKPRQLLIDLGSNLIRKQIDNYLFVNRMLEDIKVLSYFFDVLVISDARLVEELEIPRQKVNNVKIVNITRPNFDNGLTVSEKSSLTELGLNNYDNYDYKIINDEDLEKLKYEVNKMLEEMDS